MFLITVEPSQDTDGQFEVNIESDTRIQQGEAQFNSLAQAVEFFNYATEMIKGEKVFGDFCIREEQERFLQLH